MSPWPSRLSAPAPSRITRESVCDETANAMRDGTFALIIPVITSTDGRCVASTRWIPTARDFCASRMTASSTSCGEIIIRSASSSMTTSRYGQALLAALAQRAVRLGEVARPQNRQLLVAPLHLRDDVRQRRGGLLRARHDRREQVRDRLVEPELDPLRVDQDHAHLVRRRAEQDRREDRVDAAGLARAGRAGDQEVRHAREVGPDRGARDVLAEPDRERARGCGQVVEDVAERDEVRLEIRDLDAHRLLARDRREDPDLGRRERIGEVVLQCGDLRDLRAGRELQLVACDARSGDLADRSWPRFRSASASARARRRSRSATSTATSLAEEERRRIARSGSVYSSCSAELAHVEEARLVGVLGGDGLDRAAATAGRRRSRPGSRGRRRPAARRPGAGSPAAGSTSRLERTRAASAVVRPSGPHVPSGARARRPKRRRAAVSR